MIFMLIMLNDEEYGKFTRLYKVFHTLLLNRAYAILKDKHLAEDAVQETFIRAMKNLTKLRENDRSKTWYYLVTILERVSFTIRRKENPNILQDMEEHEWDMLVDRSEPVWSGIQARELYQKIKDYILSNVSDIDRKILMLRCVHKMSYLEIGNLIGISESNVSVRLTRLRKNMKADLLHAEAIL